MNSSGFSGTGSLGAANNVYLTATTVDLALGTTTSNNIHFVIGGSSTDAMTINTSGAVAVNGSYGTSGQVLTSGGSSAVPTWTTPISTSTANNFTALQTFTGTTTNLSSKFLNAKEAVTVSATAATGTVAYYATTQSVLYYTTNASANWTVNLTGASTPTTLDSMMSTGESLTVAFLVTQGSTPYYNSSVQVDGTTSGVTTKWQGGSAPTSGNASSIDAYVYTIVKTGSATFTVFASQTQFA
jgi:hypothetical protein